MRFSFLVASAVLSVTLSAAEVSAPPTVRPAADPERDGQELAAKLRESVPERESEFKGTLVITPREGQPKIVPITSKIRLHSTNWSVTYHALGHGGQPGETLIITHAPDQPNRYQLLPTNGPALDPEGLAKCLSDAELVRPFASSDFWLMDLGLEFFHWPRQRKVKNEMRRSRSCNVLESLNPNPATAGYVRVLSWIDVETGGIIRAEAFARGDTNRPVKEFELGSFRKVDGQHQLESMKIRSKKTGQETELKFELQKK